MAKCPHCEKLITLDESTANNDRREVRREVCGLAKKEVMYSCPHCDKIIGFGFFVGGWLTGRP